MSNAGLCELCQRPANQRCSGCHLVFYCSKEHQKQGWKTHKVQCRPCKVQEDKLLGRYLVATKSIKAGDVIFKERPLICGPSQVTVPVCLGCGKVIVAENFCTCAQCGWPMCSEICQKNPIHLPECRYTIQRGEKVSIRNYGIVHPIYQCVTVLRCLYQKQFLPENWTKLNKLQSHCEERKNTSKYRNEKVQVAEFIRRFFKLDQIFTEDDIMKICGIVMVNSHEVPLNDPSSIAIYEMCSMLEHNCRPNCSKSFTNDGAIVLVAAQDIPKDEHLSICYADALWGTPNRRHYLNETKFFWCNCVRCSDVTEFGTNFSAIKCQEKSCDGYLLPKTFLEKADNSKECDWICDKCNKTIPYFSVQDILERIGSDIIELPKDNVETLKKFIDSCSCYLHPNHFYLTEIKIALAQIIGQNPNGEDFVETNDDDLDMKVKITSQLLSLASILAPAERRLRGTLYFELHAAVAELGRRAGTKFGDTETLYKRLTEAHQYLLECIEFLKHEPSLLPEGQILKQAKLNLRSIDLVLQKIQESVSNPI